MSNDSPHYAVVAVALPVSRLYHYAIPPVLNGIEPGHAVLIPFGKRTVSGIVVHLTRDCPVPESRVKPILQLLMPTPLFSPSLLELLRWAADYYHHPLGEVARTALPPGILVQSSLTVSITPEGEACLNLHACPDAETRKLLEHIRARSPKRWSALLEDLGGENTVGLLRKAERAGWIAVSHQVDRPTSRPRQVRVFRPGAPVLLQAVRGRAQRAVLEILSAMGESDLPGIRDAMQARGHAVSSLSAVLKRLEKAGWVEVSLQEAWRDDSVVFDCGDQAVTLTDEQSHTLQALRQAIGSGHFTSFLLHGVTGSGKTEIYLQAVEHTLEQGRGALVLVPEIALTPQLVGRFRARFGEQVVCMHSGMSPGGRFDAWRKLERGMARVAIGARSAVFSPVTDLGLIVVDEEHDASFKQDSGFRYNARDLAVVRAKLINAVVLLGSATPSVETESNARNGKYRRLTLVSRVQNRSMPQVHIVDMRHPENRPQEDAGGLSAPLEQALQQALDAGEQAILLLNRRGFAPFVICTRCGGAYRCTRCDISLTYHRKQNALLCHYCGLTVPIASRCPHCHHPTLTLLGQGTERLEQALANRFPQARVGRLDRDTTRTRNAHARILDAFRKRDIQILTGTQMVVKGHDFPGVTVVGILEADHGLNLPDFRAAERTFQLVTQVAGRAGRGNRPGSVFVQTYSPNHPSIRLAAQHDFNGFFQEEMRVRKAYGYPPFARLALIRIKARQEDRAAHVASDASATLRELVKKMPDARLLVLGPAPAPISRLKQWYRWQILLKAGSAGALHALVARFLEVLGKQPGRPDVQVAVDVDPQQLL